MEAGGHGIVERVAVSRQQAADELLLMGMRLSQGVDVARFAALGGAIDTERRAALEDQKLVDWNPDTGFLALTGAGRLVANTVIAQLSL